MNNCCQLCLRQDVLHQSVYAPVERGARLQQFNNEGQQCRLRSKLSVQAKKEVEKMTVQAAKEEAEKASRRSSCLRLRASPGLLADRP